VNGKLIMRWLRNCSPFTIYCLLFSSLCAMPYALYDLTWPIEDFAMGGRTRFSMIKQKDPVTGQTALGSLKGLVIGEKLPLWFSRRKVITMIFKFEIIRFV
jgi:hypothetical protein